MSEQYIATEHRQTIRASQTFTFTSNGRKFTKQHDKAEAYSTFSPDDDAVLMSTCSKYHESVKTLEEIQLPVEEAFKIPSNFDSHKESNQ